MSGIRMIRSRTAVLPVNDIDTDQIIPARFLTTTRSEGFSRALFADWRIDATGRPRPEFVLNRPETAGCAILVAGRNFGCGSSREHAAWALRDFGFRAIVSTAFADIFRSNALKNGLLPVTVDEDLHSRLLAHPGLEVAIDLEATTVTLADGSVARFPIEAFARYCLLHGTDELGYLLAQQPAIDAFERRRGG